MSGTVSPEKPLGQKAYGSIPHLPKSRMGPGDHACHEGQARIATERARDRHDVVWVQEKLDGSCVSVARIDNAIVALGRAGYLAATSPYRMHHLFADWAEANRDRFLALLTDGERTVGEWLAQAHGTRYDLTDREPFVAFDLMVGGKRATVEEMRARTMPLDIRTPAILGSGPTSIPDALQALGTYGHYGATDPVEGTVWRVERKGAVDFLVKYVRPDKVDGSYLDSVTGGEPIWNWQPERAAA